MNIWSWGYPELTCVSQFSLLFVILFCLIQAKCLQVTFLLLSVHWFWIKIRLHCYTWIEIASQQDPMNCLVSTWIFCSLNLCQTREKVEMLCWKRRVKFLWHVLCPFVWALIAVAKNEKSDSLGAKHSTVRARKIAYSKCRPVTPRKFSKTTKHCFSAFRLILNARIVCVPIVRDRLYGWREKKGKTARNKSLCYEEPKRCA